MKRFTLPLTVLAALTFNVSAADDDVLADVHAEINGGCESCHTEGGEPTDDFVAENQACQDCHGSADELEGDHHAIHAELMMCSDCHEPHEMPFNQKPSCDTCHDDGRTVE
ncbi:cytochrome c3 family protein [Ferrimonas lipolytica]|uniref:Cytochrome c3 family protein n=1 Tax=Ferrimonas lipolytica TaxID=2724191 RepID=A0A6H1UAH2_9GAMM|nr:cytochrome c3 family protein [Ferrimonas lipolytica]QIZ76034.1 cytochrome c3 family protein [Ferrimonas lipolytica]